MPKSLEPWGAFGDQLTGALAELAPGAFLILVADHSNRFVQFAAQGHGGMRVETTSNQFLAAAEQLDARQIAQLIALGWIAPGLQHSGEKPGSLGPNFTIVFPRTEAKSTIAMLAIKTFRDVLLVPDPAWLRYAASALDGEALLLPGLGLLPEQPLSS
jgi:hypothetical protein